MNELNISSLDAFRNLALESTIEDASENNDHLLPHSIDIDPKELGSHNSTQEGNDFDSEHSDDFNRGFNGNFGDAGSDTTIDFSDDFPDGVGVTPPSS